jgi:hypothetical protein
MSPPPMQALSPVESTDDRPSVRFPWARLDLLDDIVPKVAQHPDSFASPATTEAHV